MFVASAGWAEEDCSGLFARQSLRDKLLVVNLSGIGAITAWGVANWDYFSRSPNTNSEGWFGNGTDEGGADKLGHLYGAYATAHGIAHLLEQSCIEHARAARYGAWSSFVIMNYMEIGDSFSDYGFAWEDFVMNGFGSLAGYYLYRYPSLGEKFDLRWEYRFDRISDDLLTDYENSRYLLAVKGHGFARLRSTPLRFAELHIGYYARGFEDPLDQRERVAYLGLGFNFTDTLRNAGYRRAAAVFKYLQPPSTTLAAEKDYND